MPSGGLIRYFLILPFWLYACIWHASASSINRNRKESLLFLCFRVSDRRSYQPADAQQMANGRCDAFRVLLKSSFNVG